MAERALYLSSGARKQLQDADTMGMGTGGLEMLASGAMKLGADANSSSMELGKSGATATFKGVTNFDEASTFDSTLGVTGLATFSGNAAADEIDAATATTMKLGAATATAVELGASDAHTTVKGNLTVDGNLAVTGTETITGNTTFNEDVNIGDGTNTDDKVTFRANVESSMPAEAVAAGGAAAVGMDWVITMGAGGAADTGASETAAAGGAVTFTAGTGGAGAASTNTAGAIGGAVNYVGGTGGAGGAAGSSAGTGGASTVKGGVGGGNTGASTSGLGGAAKLLGGAGGISSGATGTGGTGGAVSIAGGAGGGANGGVEGNGGAVSIDGGDGATDGAITIGSNKASSIGIGHASVTTTFTGVVNVGVDDTGYDVKFFGATSGKYWEWDESADQMNVSGAAKVTGVMDLDGSLDFDGTTFAVDASGSIDLTSTENAASAIYLRANGGTSETIKIHSDQGTGAGSITVVSDAGGIDIDATAGAIDILAGTTLSAKGAGGASLGDDVGTWEFDGAGAVTETGMTSLAVTPSGAITLTAGAASTWSTSAGALTLTSAAAATWSTSAGDLAITGAADLQLSAGTDLVLSDGNKSGSGYGTELILSDTSAEWDTFESLYGEVSLLGAINSAGSGSGLITAKGAEVITQWMVVAFADGGSADDRTVFKGVFTSDTDKARAAGFAQDAGTDGGSMQVQVSGEVTIPDALWDSAPAATNVGDPVYASVTTNGEVTMTAPSTAGQVLQQVGIISFADASADTTRVLVQIGERVVL